MKKYQTIYADPPWNERGGGKIKRGADRHYPLMSTVDICNMQIDGKHVSHLAGDNAHLYLWATNNFLPDALEVMDHWGFRYISCITWLKESMGLGQYFRGQTEQCLFGVRGRLPYKEAALSDMGGTMRAQGITAIYSPKGRHSAKPAEMRSMIERVSHGPFIELFAREPHDGWDVWGNEVLPTIKL